MTLATALVTPVRPLARVNKQFRHGAGMPRGAQRTLSEVLGLVTVTELDSLVDTGRSTGGNGGTEETYV